MKIPIYLYYFFRSVILRGFFNTLKLLKAEVDHEKKFGISTAVIKKSDSKEFFHYQGAGYLVLLRILSSVYRETKNYSFVDIGCGKGRVLCVAEYCGYNDLTGIELDESLLKEADKNVKHYLFKRTGSNFSLLHINALEYSYKDEPTIYFLFNPFNEEVLRKVLNKIKDQTRSETWFVYMNPLYPLPFKENNIELVKEFKTRFYREANVYRIPGSH